MKKQVRRIDLRPIHSSNGPKLFQWRNTETIYTWCRQVDVLEYKNHEDWLENQALDKTTKMYEIWCDPNIYPKPSELVGVCGLTDIDLQNQRAEFSLYIGPEFHGQGYGKLALKELLDHAFTRYPLNIIWGETIAGNRALDTFKSIGFKEEGIRRDFYFKNGTFKDAILVSIRRKEFYGSDRAYTNPTSNLDSNYAFSTGPALKKTK